MEVQALLNLYLLSCRIIGSIYTDKYDTKCYKNMLNKITTAAQCIFTWVIFYFNFLWINSSLHWDTMSKVERNHFWSTIKTPISELSLPFLLVSLYYSFVRSLLFSLKYFLFPLRQTTWYKTELSKGKRGGFVSLCK